jgi:hypothetical protein
VGNLAEARRILDRLATGDFAVLRAGREALVTAALLAETCATLADEARAETLYRFLEPFAQQWIAWTDTQTLGPVTFFLGLLARTRGRPDDAARHFEHALASTTAAAARPYAARTQLEFAVLLRRRDAPGDAARADVLLRAALLAAETLGMDTLRAQAAALLHAEAPAPDGSRQVFRCDGDFWTIAYAGRTVRLRDMRGLHYLAQLLWNPGREIEAIALVSRDQPGREAAPADPSLRIAHHLGDAGPALDARARAAYARRLAEIDAALDQPARSGDTDPARLRGERDALQAALGKGDRVRRDASHVERARLTVTKGIKAAITRIGTAHPALAAHLTASVRRGYACVYVPDPRHPTEWAP